MGDRKVTDQTFDTWLILHFPLFHSDTLHSTATRQTPVWEVKFSTQSNQFKSYNYYDCQSLFFPFENQKNVICKGSDPYINFTKRNTHD